MEAAKNQAWTEITLRYGNTIDDPSAEDIATAITELYHENIASFSEGNYAEHPKAWLRYGFDEGPMYLLDVYRGGLVVFSQWADTDYTSELAPESSMKGVSEEMAIQLWKWLVNGDIDIIKSEPWKVM